MEGYTRNEFLFYLQVEIEYLEREIRNPTGTVKNVVQKLSYIKQKYLDVLNIKHVDNFSFSVSTKKIASVSDQERELANYFYLRIQHDKNIHKRILLKDSKSLALAPPDSEQFIKAIVMRLKNLFHLKKYEHCVIDIDRVFPLVKSMDIDTKLNLLSDKIKCLISMKKDDEAKEVLNEASAIVENASFEIESLRTELLTNLQGLFTKEYSAYNPQKRKEEDLGLKNFNDLPYISEAVSFKYNSKFGKHLIANRDIATGEILLVENPYCIYPNIESLYLTCSHCLKFTYNGIPCKNCAFAVYCSHECQASAFEEYHDIECSINPLLFEKRTEYIDSNSYFSRFFIKLLKDFGVKKIIKEARRLDKTRDERNNDFAKDGNSILKSYNVFQIVYGLIDPVVRKPVAVDETFPQVFLQFLKKENYYSEELDDKNMSKLNKIFLNLIFKNPHSYKLYAAKFHKLLKVGIREVDVEGIGKSLTPLSVFLNHNCYYNAGRVFISGSAKFLIVATRPIKKNEQVYTNYKSGIEYPKEVRLIEHSEYNFKCNCLGCTNNWPALGNEMIKSYYQEFHVNKNKHPELAKSIKKFYNLKFFKDSEPWEYNKKNIQEICDIIDKCYPSHSTLKGATVLCRMMQTLNVCFYSVYNDYFDIPDDCAFQKQ